MEEQRNAGKTEGPHEESQSEASEGVGRHEQSQTQASERTGESVDTHALVVTCISLLAAKAWEGMGLVPDPATKKIERRFDDAQLAIDAVAALIEIVRARVAETDRRELDTLLMNLRLNFVEQKSKAGGEGQPSGG